MVSTNTPTTHARRNWIVVAAVLAVIAIALMFTIGPWNPDNSNSSLQTQSAPNDLENEKVDEAKKASDAKKAAEDKAAADKKAADDKAAADKAQTQTVADAKKAADKAKADIFRKEAAAKGLVEGIDYQLGDKVDYARWDRLRAVPGGAGADTFGTTFHDRYEFTQWLRSGSPGAEANIIEFQRLERTLNGIDVSRTNYQNPENHLDVQYLTTSAAEKMAALSSGGHVYYVTGNDVRVDAAGSLATIYVGPEVMDKLSKGESVVVIGSSGWCKNLQLISVKTERQPTYEVPPVGTPTTPTTPTIITVVQKFCKPNIPVGDKRCEEVPEDKCVPGKDKECTPVKECVPGRDKECTPVKECVPGKDKECTPVKECIPGKDKECTPPKPVTVCRPGKGVVTLPSKDDMLPGDLPAASDCKNGDNDLIKDIGLNPAPKPPGDPETEQPVEAAPAAPPSVTPPGSEDPVSTAPGAETPTTTQPIPDPIVQAPPAATPGTGDVDPDAPAAAPVAATGAVAPAAAPAVVEAPQVAAAPAVAPVAAAEVAPVVEAAPAVAPVATPVAAAPAPVVVTSAPAVISTSAQVATAPAVAPAQQVAPASAPTAVHADSAPSVASAADTAAPVVAQGAHP